MEPGEGKTQRESHQCLQTHEGRARLDLHPIMITQTLSTGSIAMTSFKKKKKNKPKQPTHLERNTPAVSQIYYTPPSSRGLSLLGGENEIQETKVIVLSRGKR